MDALTIWSDAGDHLTSALFEDDGRVAYCYVIEDDNIVSDVWVYNRTKTPTTKPWKEGEEPPYLNPEEYALEMSELPGSMSDVHIEWENQDGAKPIALVHVSGTLFARVSAAEKPGHARLARKEGPLAKPLLP